MTPREHAKAFRRLKLIEGYVSPRYDSALEAAIREAAAPLVAALRNMLWPDGVKPDGEDGKRCHFPPPCEVCDAKAALAAWESDGKPD
jgi:hypothetical protein